MRPSKLIITLVLALAALAAAQAAGAQPRAHTRELLLAPPLSPGDPKLDSQLEGIARTAPSARRHAMRALGVDSSANRVRVVLETNRGRTAAARTAVRRAGGTVEAEYGALVQALVPPASLFRIAHDASVSYLRRPYRPVDTAITGEEVAATNAAALHAQGVNGAGVKIAVIDSGFKGLADALAQGEIPASAITVDDCGGKFDSASVHGTATAQIVAEMAPGAQLYLICVSTEVTLGQAEQYAKQQGVRIISHSANWFNTSRGDGRGRAGTPDAVVADARASGILWVNSAGNYAQRHWSGTFVDGNADNIHDFTPQDEGETLTIDSGEDVCAYLKWDDWPRASSDFDLFLGLSSTNAIVARSTDVQNGSQEPTEDICYRNDTGSTQKFFFSIARKSGTTGTPRMDLFITNGSGIEYVTGPGSIGEPASSPNALAVGAICWQNNALQPYSSLGPTIDGRVKPDIAVQDAVSSSVYGASRGCSSGFTGTSASAPGAAGAAALVLQSSPGLGPADLQAFLEGTSVDLGAPGKDNQFGSGRLFLSSLPSAKVPVISYPSPSATGVTATAATVVGSVNPQGADTTYVVEYGITTSYGSKTAAVALPGGTSFQSITAQLTGLAPATTYHFRISATNKAGTSVGIDQTFTTPSGGAPPQSADTVPPLVKAVASSGKAGKSVRLLLNASDDNGKVRLEATVLRGAKVLTTIRTGLAAVTPGDMYFVTWKATARRETLSFCVRAWDAAGNVSPPSCAPLRIL
jgi:hypothetical protein